MGPAGGGGGAEARAETEGRSADGGAIATAGDSADGGHPGRRRGGGGARAAATATGLVVMVEETACLVFASIGAWGKPARACVSDAAARWLDTPEPGALCATGAALSGDARSADEIARN